MGSKTSKAKRPAITTPRTPQDIINEILDHLATDSDFESLLACALVSKSWILSCQRHLFHTANFTSQRMDRWFNMFPVPEESPAHHVRVLDISIRGANWFPEKFFEHAPQFTNVRSLSLLGEGYRLGPRLPSLWRLPESVTSLTIDVSRKLVSLLAIWDIMVRLPNLDDLSLWGPFIQMNGGAFLGIGTVPRGRVGGKLVVRDVHYGNRGVINMLLEIPTGLHFTKVEVDRARDFIPSVIRLAEVCRKTIVELTLNVVFNGKYRPFSWSG